MKRAHWSALKSDVEMDIEVSRRDGHGRHWRCLIPTCTVTPAMMCRVALEMMRSGGSGFALSDGGPEPAL